MMLHGPDGIFTLDAVNLSEITYRVEAHRGYESRGELWSPGYFRVTLPQLDEDSVGSISEIFDAEPPFTPRGCIAQAWSVAEVLRAWIKTAH
jgi:glycogen debranching enzyme